MGKVIMSGIVPQLNVPSAGTPISEFAVGSTVKMNVDGVATDFLIVHQGLPSSLYDESCNGTWLLMKDIYESRQWNSEDNNDYENSTIHSYLNGNFLSLFDTKIQDSIKQVKIPYFEYSLFQNAVASGANGLSTKIFLLGGYEIGFNQSVNQYFPIDGEKLDYFIIGTGSTSALEKRIANMNNSAYYWWLRSPLTREDIAAYYSSSTGDSGAVYCSESAGIRPALILPPTTLIDKDGNVKGVT